MFQDIFVSFKFIFLEKNIVIVFKIATCTKSCQFTINTAKLGINWYQYQLKKPFTYYQTITNFYCETSLYFQMKIATDFFLPNMLKERTWLYSFELNQFVKLLQGISMTSQFHRKFFAVLVWQVIWSQSCDCLLWESFSPLWNDVRAGVYVV